MKNNFKSTLNVGLISHHLSEINMLVNLLIVSLYFRFYPFHYAPYMSDIRNFGEMLIQFELCTPFLPFEQLLAVLPAASRQLLPKPFQVLFHSYKWFYVFFILDFTEVENTQCVYSLVGQKHSISIAYTTTTEQLTVCLHGLCLAQHILVGKILWSSNKKSYLMNAEPTNERGKDMLTECKLIIMCLDLKLLS